MSELTTSSSSQTSSTHEPEPRTNVLGLSTAQVVGSALAAATSALAASFLGVAGTIIGAVVGSLVATIASAVYAHSLRQASTRIREVRPVIVTRHADTHAHVVQGPQTGVVTGDAADAQAADAQPADAQPAGDRPHPRRSLPRWAGVAAGVVAAAGLALGGITGIEALLGHPVSNSSATGTSLGKAFGGSGAPSEKKSNTPSTDQPTTTPRPSETATQGASPTDTATSSPTGQGQPTGTPTESAPLPTGPSDQGLTQQPTEPAAPQTPAPSQTTP